MLQSIVHSCFIIFVINDIMYYISQVVVHAYLQFTLQYSYVKFSVICQRRPLSSPIKSCAELNVLLMCDVGLDFKCEIICNHTNCRLLHQIETIMEYKFSICLQICIVMIYPHSYEKIEVRNKYVNKYVIH